MGVVLTKQNKHVAGAARTAVMEACAQHTGVMLFALRYSHLQVAMSVADEQLKPWLPSGGLPPGLLALAGACCDYDPAMRPDFDLIVSEMSEALEAMKAEVSRVVAASQGRRT